MFGSERFGLMRFNVPLALGEALGVEALMEAVVDALVGSGEDVHGEVFALGAVEALAQAGAEVPEWFDGAVQTGMRAAAYTVFGLQVPLVAAFGGGARGIVHVWLRVAGDAVVDGAPWLGVDVPAAVAGDVAVRVDAALGATVRFVPVALDASVLSQVTTRLFDWLEAVYDVTLRPGQVLVVDSDQYTVLLDGEDVIDRQAGDWVRLSPRVHDVVFEVVEGKVADLEKTVLYTEKWL